MNYSIDALLQVAELQKRMENVWFRQAVGTRLRTLRIERRIPQATLAIAAGMTNSNLCKIEMGTRFLTIRDIAALSQALGVTPNELLSVPEETLIG